MGRRRRPARATPFLPDARLRVGAELGDRLVALSGRQDLLVTCRPGTRSGAPAAFFPTLGEVKFDAGLFAPLQPHEIHPRIVGDEERYPAAWGVFVHEAAHAAHSVWTASAGANPRVVEAALLLEESRVEGAHLITRPTDRTYLRTSARPLVMPDLAHPALQGIEHAAPWRPTRDWATWSPSPPPLRPASVRSPESA
jgi:hypothetical protein